MLVNPLEFVLRKAQVFQRLNILFQLFRALAPISTDVTRASFSSQLSAICAMV